MSYTTHRPSILHRKQRQEPSRANEESLETQYQREQALLRAKQERQQETHQRLLRSLNPQPEDKAAAWEALVASNAMLAGRTPKSVPDEYPAFQSSSGGGLPEGTRPWHHSMATQKYSEAEEEAARRRFAAEVAAENQRLAREKEMTRMMEEQARRQPVQDTWYSRGDTHRQVQTSHGGFSSVSSSGTSTPAAMPHRPSSACPWAPTAGDAEVTVWAQPGQWQPKASDRQYPWSWKQ
ncbi:hypothetical protein PLESTF_001897200 [Pleodorina starrii]|nr:hypothetical protein PLESTM_000935500 [Pleodorina starrii]GLC77197.1 hypothetical protein PLESTF_001897200 [Pleodorina starrii]